MKHEPAIVIAHPSSPSPVLQDPREQRVLDPDREAAICEVMHLVERYGSGQVKEWIDRITAIQATVFYQERPADRCLADGAALVNTICVQCGRDNS